MTFEGSYMWHLRKKVGHDLVLVPGALVVLRRDDGRVLMMLRGDDGTWGLPAGLSEPGQGFLGTARTEVFEEVGVELAPESVVAFGSLSEPDLHTITYPNGDVSQIFSLCFLAERWEGDPRPDGVEATELRWIDPSSPPAPTHPAASAVLPMLAEYERTGLFQAS